MKQRIVFVANRGFALFGSRRVLLERLMAEGHEVSVATAADDYAYMLEALGVQRFVVNFMRGSVALRADVRALGQLIKVYRDVKPALVHHFHAKPMFYGAVAAQRAGVPLVVNTVTGLGESMPEQGIKARLAHKMYAHACGTSRYTVFQNSDDLGLFKRYGLVQTGRERLITSSGVDVRRYQSIELSEKPVRVVCMARLLKKKGIREFIEAAREVRSRFGALVVFELAGEWDLQHPDAVTEQELEAWNHDDVVKFVGYCKSPEDWLPGATAFVCPSVYREGVPRVVLEAAACGVPVVGTDAAGIRDAVRDTETGYLVPANDVLSLVEAVMKLLNDPERAAAMGRAARDLMERDFDIERITDQYCELYRQAGLQV